MSLPEDRLSYTPVPSVLLSPDDIGRPTRVEDYEQGGSALNDAAAGLQVQNWRLRLLGTEIRIAPAPYDVETTLITAAGISQCSFAFDQNMNPAVAYVQSNQAKLYWFDSVPSAMVTTVLAADVRSPFLTMDDKREHTNTRNDVLLFYIRGNRLAYRQQRDRYTIERTLAWFDGSMLTIRKAGMNSGLRMQIEIVGTSNKIATGAVLGAWGDAAYLVSATSIGRAAPAGIATNDSLHAVLMHRTAATPPAGWTLVTSKACDGDVAQTISIYRKDTATPADSGVTFTFSQAGSERIGLMYFAVRMTTGVAPTYIGATSVAVDDTATNTVTAPIVTAGATELYVMIATTVNASADVVQVGVAPGMSVVSGLASQCRLGVAYQRRAVGQTNAGRFTFDVGSPVNNGLAAITMRFT